MIHTLQNNAPIIAQHFLHWKVIPLTWTNSYWRCAFTLKACLLLQLMQSCPRMKYPDHRIGHINHYIPLHGGLHNGCSSGMDDNPSRDSRRLQCQRHQYSYKLPTTARHSTLWTEDRECTIRSILSKQDHMHTAVTCCVNHEGLGQFSNLQGRCHSDLWRRKVSLCHTCKSTLVHHDVSLLQNGGQNTWRTLHMKTLWDPKIQNSSWNHSFGLPTQQQLGT